jgi:hypothetical protein
LTLLGRRPLESCTASFIQQKSIDVFMPESYQKYIEGHQTAICTLGVGEPSKMSKEDFVRIDKEAVLDFAVACKAAGVSHFQLLASVAITMKVWPLLKPLLVFVLRKYRGISVELLGTSIADNIMS